MKRIFILFTSVALVAAGCKNYDDRFDDLNSQITALQTQVNTFQGVASSVSALQAEIGNIRSSLTSLSTTVSGVTGGITNALSTAQKELETSTNASLTAAQTAIDNSLSETQRALNAKLDTALAGLQAKLAELESKLAQAQAGALSREDLAAFQARIQEQLDQVKEELEESLGDAGFHSGNVTINSSGSWQGTKIQLRKKTKFAGDFVIDTANLTATEVDELIAWVGEITLIHGDLTITHKSADKVIKFGKLTLVTDLTDTQPHAHYPALATATNIELDSNKILTVKLPVLTKGTFDDHTIDLPKATELTLTALSKYEADLTIEVDGDTVVDLSALEKVGSGSSKENLILDGPDSITLPALTTLQLLSVSNVGSLTAPKVKGADLSINDGVESVDVGTASGANINTLTIADDNDLEVLKINGNSSRKSSEKTEVIIDGSNDLETVHIQGANKVDLDNVSNLEEIVTAGTIPVFDLTNSGFRGDLVLGHQSGVNSELRIEDNVGIETLTADKVNQLRVLIIQGNHDLERISFAALKQGSTQVPRTPWYNSDAVVIGGTQFDSSGDWSDGNYHAPDRNNLIADSIHLAVGGANKQTGKIVDNTGISKLEDFLTHAKIKRAVVSYDGAESFKPHAKSTEEDVSNGNGDNFVLIRKGLQGVPTTAGKARRVFYTSQAASAGDLVVNIGNNVQRTISLSSGGSVRNWINEIKDKAVIDFFDTNDVSIDAKPGANPIGNLTFDAAPPSGGIPDGAISELKAKAYFKLTVGAYSSTVYITEGANASGTGDARNHDVPSEKAFSSSNKKAISHAFLLAGNDDTSTTPPGANIGPAEIIQALIDDFPGTVTNNRSNTATPPVLLVAHNTIPYIVASLDDNSSAITPYDRQYISKAIPVTLEYNILVDKTNNAERTLLTNGVSDATNPGFGFTLTENDTDNGENFFTTKPINNAVRTLQIELTSKIGGDSESTIGQPVDAGTTDGTTARTASDDHVESVTAPTDAAGASVTLGGAALSELAVKVEGTDEPAYPYYSSRPQLGTASTTRAGGDKNIDKLSWL